MNPRNDVLGYYRLWKVRDDKDVRTLDGPPPGRGLHADLWGIGRVYHSRDTDGGTASERVHWIWQHIKD